MTADAIVFIVCCAIGLLALGIAIGQHHKPLACPTVAGQQVISTIDSRDSQTCVYQWSSYGRATKRVRL